MEAALWRRGGGARAIRSLAPDVRTWTPEQRDTVVYACGAVFALATIRLSTIELYRQWAEIAIGPYVVGALVSALSVRRARRRERESHLGTLRVGIFLFVIAGATFLPLTLEVFLQTQTGGTTHVQPEVLVVERSGKQVAAGKDPYPAVVSKHPTGLTALELKGQPSYDQYDPYGPLMSLFGIPSSWHLPPRFLDARVYFSLVSLLLVALALALCRGSYEPRILALQGMTILPTAALPMATGGDDLPVAAFLLLAMLLLHRRRSFGAGLLLGFAAGLKFTAWPLVILALVVARDRDGRRRRGVAWVLLGMGAVLVPSVVPVFLHDPTAFLNNVVRFPLGLTKISSPAASALPGHIIVLAFPQFRRAFPFILAIVGVAVIGWVLVRHRPRTVADVCRLGGWAMTAGILFAPATRVGYLLYPINFFFWAWLMRSEEEAEVTIEAESVIAAAPVPDAAAAAVAV
jgi:hypothetical protein